MKDILDAIARAGDAVSDIRYVSAKGLTLGQAVSLMQTVLKAEKAIADTRKYAEYTRDYGICDAHAVPEVLQ